MGNFMLIFAFFSLNMIANESESLRFAYLGLLKHILRFDDKLKVTFLNISYNIYIDIFV